MNTHMTHLIYPLGESFLLPAKAEGEIHWYKTKPDGMMQKLLDGRIIINKGWKHSYALEGGIKQAYSWYINN